MVALSLNQNIILDLSKKLFTNLKVDCLVLTELVEMSALLV